MEYLISTGAFVGRINHCDYTLIPRAFPQLAFDGMELMMCGIWYDDTDEITEYLCTNCSGMFRTMHFDKDIGEYLSKGEYEEAKRRFEINCRIAQSVGAEKTVLHLWSGLPSDFTFENNARGYPYLKEISDRYGLMLTIENIPCNVETGLRRICKIRDLYPDVYFTVDTRFLAFHDEFEYLYTSDIMESVRHIHISDWNAPVKDFTKLRPILHPGEGIIDFNRFFRFLVGQGYDSTVTLESPSMSETFPDIGLLNDSGKKIKDWCVK